MGCLTSCGATCRPSGARPAREWSRRNVCVLPRQSWPTTPRPAPVLVNHSTCRSSLGQPLHLPPGTVVPYPLPALMTSCDVFGKEPLICQGDVTQRHAQIIVFHACSGTAELRQMVFVLFLFVYFPALPVVWEGLAPPAKELKVRSLVTVWVWSERQASRRGCNAKDGRPVFRTAKRKSVNQYLV